MRLCILSDIHGNLEALTRALDLAHELACDEIICLGDIVGYGPNPNECVRLVRDRAASVILGNHDHAVLNPEETETFNDAARTAVLWTRSELDEDNLSYLRELPYTIHREGILFVHASPKNPPEWDYIFTEEQAQEQFLYLDTKVCFVGHTHVPQFFASDSSEFTDPLRETVQYIINVGSIGQPRDGDPRLSFGVFDIGTWGYRHIRSEYDVKTTVEKMRNTDLPAFLAERLLRGR